MKNLRLFALCLAVLASFFVSCSEKKTTEAVIVSIDYSDTAYWYSCGDTTRAADVFYIYPTVSTISFVDNDSSWFADITVPEVREEANGNQRFNKMLYGEYNFYAPYYCQMVFEAYSQPSPVLDSLAQIAANDVTDAFQYYMTHYNHGRPFFLMGHSQGSQMLIELLKKGMTEEQRQRMVAAYCIGYHVSAEELAAYPEALQPATDSTMQGLVVFNSVTDTTAIGLVSRGDVVGVNPTTWSAAMWSVSTLRLGRWLRTPFLQSSIWAWPNTTRLATAFSLCPARQGLISTNITRSVPTLTLRWSLFQPMSRCSQKEISTSLTPGCLEAT